MKFNEIYEGLLQGKKYRLNYWISTQYIYYDESTNTIRSDDNDEYKLNSAQIMLHDVWEEYIEPINYEKCIGCLCWLYDNEDSSDKSLGILKQQNKNEFKPFIKEYYTMNLAYRFCKPVKPEEIKFYKGEE